MWATIWGLQFFTELERVMATTTCRFIIIHYVYSHMHCIAYEKTQISTSTHRHICVGTSLVHPSHDWVFRSQQPLLGWSHIHEFLLIDLLHMDTCWSHLPYFHMYIYIYIHVCVFKYIWSFVTCSFPARGVQVWARGIQELVLPIACFRTWVIEIYMLALAWRWIWWAPAIVSVLISEYWAQNRGQIHDMECQKSRCHFFVFARFNYIFSVFMSGSSQIHNLECQRLDNI